MKTITEVSQCAAAVSALGFAANFDGNDVKTSDYYDRKNGCIWHDGAKEVTLFSGSIRMEEPCNYRGYAGCLCEKSETFTTTTMETTEFVNGKLILQTCFAKFCQTSSKANDLVVYKG